METETRILHTFFKYTDIGVWRNTLSNFQTTRTSATSSLLHIKNAWRARRHKTNLEDMSLQPCFTKFTSCLGRQVHPREKKPSPDQKQRWNSRRRKPTDGIALKRSDFHESGADPALNQCEIFFLKKEKSQAIENLKMSEKIQHHGSLMKNIMYNV